MNELALFAGAGGGILGGKLLGWRTVCAVEWDGYARDVLLARQNDGSLEAFPVWDDVQTFDGHAWRGRVDVVSGGFPCQDISAAGKGAGIDGERSGMWGHMARIIREVGPRFVFVENSPMLTSRGLGRVLGDLAEMGYDARWCVLGAVDAGAPHKRERIWIVAHAKSDGLSFGWPRHEKRDFNPARSIGVWSESGRMGADGCTEALADAECAGLERRAGCGLHGTRGQTVEPACGNQTLAAAPGAGFEEQRGGIADGAEHEAAECGGWWESEPDVGRVAHGVAARVDRLRCLGNGQVPAVAALAWRIVTRNLNP